jgi:hypothetical protein
MDNLRQVPFVSKFCKIIIVNNILKLKYLSNLGIGFASAAM